MFSGILFGGAIQQNSSGWFADGSAGAPSVSFNSERTLGFYRAAAEQVGLSGSFKVSGNILVSSLDIFVQSLNHGIYFAGNGAILGNTTGAISVVPAPRAAGISPYFTLTPAADTGINANTEAIGLLFPSAVRTFLDGAVAQQREIVLTGPTYNKTNVALNLGLAATLFVSPPTLGAGVTAPSGIFSIWASGAIRADGGITIGNTTLITSSAALANGAAAAAGTLNNAPIAGNPTKWVPINDNGTIRYIPCW